MEKIYGFKQDDILNFAKFITQNDNLSLQALFQRYSAISGKAQGTIRNLYYAIAKCSNKNSDFCQNVLNGHKIQVNSIVEFDSFAERDLVKSVLLLKNKGNSIRKAVLLLSNDDSKKALRFQNKYRNLCKNKPNLISDVIDEISKESKNNNLISAKSEPISQHIPDTLLFKLKKDINGLVDKISAKVRSENAYLKRRVDYLEMENLRLTNMLFSGDKKPKVKDFFSNNKQSLLN